MSQKIQVNGKAQQILQDPGKGIPDLLRRRTVSHGSVRCLCKQTDKVLALPHRIRAGSHLFPHFADYAKTYRHPDRHLVILQISGQCMDSHDPQGKETDGAKELSQALTPLQSSQDHRRPVQLQERGRHHQQGLQHRHPEHGRVCLHGLPYHKQGIVKHSVFSGDFDFVRFHRSILSFSFSAVNYSTKTPRRHISGTKCTLRGTKDFRLCAPGRGYGRPGAHRRKSFYFLCNFTAAAKPPW